MTAPLTPAQLAAWQAMVDEAKPLTVVDDDESRVSISNGEIYIASSDYFSRAHKALRIEAREGVGRIVAMANAVPDLLAEVHRLRLEVSLLDADLDSMAARETAALRAEVERLASDLGHVEPAEEPDAAVLTSPHRCDCCGTVIEPGDSAVMFTDEAGRECWAHYGVCPEPDLWCVEWQLKETSRWSAPTGWIRPRHMDGSTIAEPYEDALTFARARAASRHVSRVRLVRCKEPSRG